MEVIQNMRVTVILGLGSVSVGAGRIHNPTKPGLTPGIVLQPLKEPQEIGSDVKDSAIKERISTAILFDSLAGLEVLEGQIKIVREIMEKQKNEDSVPDSK